MRWWFGVTISHPTARSTRSGTRMAACSNMEAAARRISNASTASGGGPSASTPVTFTHVETQNSSA